jgi:hypothetical protein
MPLGDKTIRTAFAEVGRRLRLDRNVEILIVGGAAGVLTDELPPAWTTADVDMIHCHLPQDRDAVLDAAGEAAQVLWLPPSWLSEDAGLFAWTLPGGWERRRVPVGTYGRLRVFAAGRLDLMAMKFVAHRGRDLEHLAELAVTAAELEWVRRELDVLAGKYPEQSGRLEMARQYVNGWAAAQ